MFQVQCSNPVSSLKILNCIVIGFNTQCGKSGQRQKYSGKGNSIACIVSQEIFQNETERYILYDHGNNNHHIDNAHVYTISFFGDTTYHQQIGNAHHAGPSYSKTSDGRKK